MITDWDLEFRIAAAVYYNMIKVDWVKGNSSCIRMRLEIGGDFSFFLTVRSERKMQIIC
jgi:hypothetical protein